MLTEKNINGLLAVFFMVLAAGLFFHQSETFAKSLPGHLIGIVGTVMMVLTLIYPFKKRLLGRRGKQNPLTSHIFYGLAGPSLVIIHSAHKLDSLIGLLTFLAMLIVVLSGITGRFLFRRVGRTLQEQRKDLQTLKDGFHERREEAAACSVSLDLRSEDDAANGAEMDSEPAAELQRERCEQILELARSISELEYAATIFDSTKTLFSRWMRVHHFLTIFLFAFIILHIVTVLYYGLGWVS